MSHTIDRLVRMANQIGHGFARNPDAQAVQSIAEHIRSFWEKRMREEIYAYLDAGGAGLDERPRRAIELLKQEERQVSGAF